MEELIKIKCPFDGAVLKVMNQPGIESKNVTCPICKHKYPFTEFKRVDDVYSNEDPDTELPGGEEKTRYRDSEETTSLNQPDFTIGELYIPSMNKVFRLSPGRNLIGRKATKTTATIQIDTGEKRSMSREHLVIDVKKVPAKGMVHYVSLAKEKVNKTMVGNEVLNYGDCFVLQNGDVIALPDVTLKFRIPDEEKTDF